MKNKERGFTLVEMMVVLLIIGIVATVVTVSVGGKPDEARKKATKALLAKLKGEVELFKVDQGRYPERLEDLRVRPPYVDERKWPEHGYRDDLVQDAWDRPYRYAVPGTRGAFDIISLGADGKEGGEGVNEDLWSHPPR
jgi:general secretion pathway protein G